MIYLGSGAFDNCTALEEILIPSSVEYIGEDVFKDCKQLKYISYTGSQEEWEQIKIEENNDDLKEIPVKYNVTVEKENDMDTNDEMDEEVAALTEDSIKETESAEENTDIEPEMDNYSDEVQESERTIKVYFSEEASQKNLEQIKNAIEKEPAVAHIEQAGNEEAWQEFINDYFLLLILFLLSSLLSVQQLPHPFHHLYPYEINGDELTLEDDDQEMVGTKE